MRLLYNISGSNLGRKPNPLRRSRTAHCCNRVMGFFSQVRTHEGDTHTLPASGARRMHLINFGFNLGREANTLSTRLAVHIVVMPDAGFNLRREANPLATSIFRTYRAE